VCGVVGHALAPQCLGQLLAGAGAVGEQPQADLAGDGDRVGVGIELGRAAPSPPA
jgi:hypothetical protein